MRLRFIFDGLLLAAAVVALPVQAQDLRYDWQPAQKFAYHVEIVVDLPDMTETYQGDITYAVKSVDADSRQVEYLGGLTKKVVRKTPAQGRGPGRPGIGPRALDGPSFSPFSQNNFRGTDWASNDLTMSPYGKLTKMRGDSHLPYLLGNVSMLPFEPLPNPSAKEWKVGSALSITEKEERTDRRPRFDDAPRSPRSLGNTKPEQSQSASESATYTVAGEQAGIVSIRKAVELNSPPPKANDAGFTMTGSGVWKFNRSLHVSESLHLEQKLVINLTNQQVTVPITIDYRRLPDDAYAKITGERKKLEDEARRKFDEHKNRQAGAQPKTESPPSTPRSDVDKSYAGPKSVPSTNRSVTADTPLYVGQIVQLRDTGAWYPADILELRPDGGVKVRFRGWGSAWDKVVRREVVQLAPDEVTQPAKSNSASGVAAAPAATPAATPAKTPAVAALPKTPAVAVPTMRTWSDASGAHKIEGTFLALADGKVKMKRKDGKEIDVPLDKLSADDQQYVSQMKAKTLPPNPFDP